MSKETAVMARNPEEVSRMLCERQQTEYVVQQLNSHGTVSLSLLRGQKASDGQILASVAKLKATFPQMGPEFWSVLAERIAKTGMTSQRLGYAVNKVIDNFTYKTLTVADVLKLDLQCEVLAYSEMLDRVAKANGTTTDYAPVRIKGLCKPVWVKKADKERLRIPDEL